MPGATHELSVELDQILGVTPLVHADNWIPVQLAKARSQQEAAK